ncbi:phenylacetate--CoA ligase family protein [Kiloniella laminariae]|uniref:phenylacetate--CoA ligase family protein n=1 Tax=Kiloniella laminariae TaxID=454162 RepID=UPI000376EED9|nr:phenylacetate--CoA ligase family protein [Kiloniella laminariae]
MKKKAVRPVTKAGKKAQKPAPTSSKAHHNWLSRFELNCAIPHLDFPVISTTTNLAVISSLTQLENTQWWTPEKIREMQFRQLYQLVRHSQKTVPYYSSYPRPDNPEHLAEIWQNYPVLAREDINTNQTALTSAKPPKSHGAVTTKYTSGSTGQPIGVKNTALSGVFWRAFTLRDHIWHQRNPNWKLGHIRVAKEGQALYPGVTGQGWSSERGVNALIRTGPTAGLNINSPLEQQGKWLLHHEPDFLITFPSIIHRLAQYFLDQGLRPKNLKQIETISEIMPEETRALCRKAFGIEPADLYSTRELGYLALQCPDHAHYHVQSEGVFLEVIKEDGSPCLPGQPGRVLVTPLHNFAMPLIRYAVGDYAVPGPPCSCGRGLPVIERILGRERNRLRHPDGGYRWIGVSASDYGILLAIAPIQEYQIIQKSLTELEFWIALPEDPGEDQVRQLQDWARSALHFPAEITIIARRSLERSANGKLELFKSLIE